MAIVFNIRHLENKSLNLQGEIEAEELGLEDLDELVHARQNLVYDLEIERLGSSILANGCLELALDCECARCLKSFRFPLVLRPWNCHLALEGEEAVPVVNDMVDLTPLVREDILLAFPQHPLCEPECGGLQLPTQNEAEKPSQSGVDSVWTVLDQLKFEK